MSSTLERFDLNLAGIAAMAVGPELLSVCRQAGRDVTDLAITFAPEDSGEYKQSFDLVDIIETSIGRPPLPPMVRVGTDLVNTADHAALVEVGWSRTVNGTTRVVAGHHPIGRAVGVMHARTLRRWGKR